MDPAKKSRSESQCSLMMSDNVDSEPTSIAPHVLQHILLFSSPECRANLCNSSSIISESDCMSELWDCRNMEVEIGEEDDEWTELLISTLLESGSARVPQRYNEMKLGLSCYCELHCCIVDNKLLIFLIQLNMDMMKNE